MSEQQNAEASIEALRRSIDETDAELFELIEKRARLAGSIGRLKGGAPVYRPEREREILELAVKRAHERESVLSDESVRTLVREIVSACRAVEAKPRTAFLGPRGTFTEEAVVRQFGSSCDMRPCASIDEVFREVASEAADYAVVPVENSTEGVVTRTADLLMTTPLTVIAEVHVPVHHNLMNRSGSLEDIREVHAHPQALAQCRGWLSMHLPQAKLVSSSSNAQAAKEAAADPATAALAAERAASLYELKIVAPAVEDDPRNTTRFLVLGRTAARRARGVAHKTSLIFSVPNRAGALLEALEPFSRHGVSMMRLESRPARNGYWDYNFYADIEGHIEDEAVAAALAELSGIAPYIKILGSYAAAL